MDQAPTFKERTEQEENLIEMILIAFSDILPPEVYDVPCDHNE